MTHPEMEAARLFAAVLSVPVFLVDPDGDLVYYNTEAGHVLGREFNETGTMPAAVWGRIFVPTDEEEIPLAPDALPLMIALSEGRPAAEKIWIRGIDNERRHIHVVAFPIKGEGGMILGAMAIFWKLE